MAIKNHPPKPARPMPLNLLSRKPSAAPEAVEDKPRKRRKKED